MCWAWLPSAIVAGVCFLSFPWRRAMLVCVRVSCCCGHCCARLTALTELERVYGIGPARAKELLDDHGIKNLPELLARQDLCVPLPSPPLSLLSLYHRHPAWHVMC